MPEIVNLWDSLSDLSHEPSRWPTLRSRRGKEDNFGRARRSATIIQTGPILATNRLARLPQARLELLIR